MEASGAILGVAGELMLQDLRYEMLYFFMPVFSQARVLHPSSPDGARAVLLVVVVKILSRASKV
jgi:hypothetical protein